MAKRLIALFIVFASSNYFFGPYSRADGTSTEIAREESDDGSDASIGQLQTESRAESLSESKLDRFSLDYFAIFYGPSLQNPSAYQPTPSGEKNLDRPVIVKNFLGLGYKLSDHVTLTGTAHWVWRPVLGQELILRDPFVRLSHNQIVNANGLNLYGDVRVHFGVSPSSREQDMLTSLQSIQILTYVPGAARFTFGLYGSERAYILGKQGYGNDLELYLGPNISFQVSRTVGFSLLYEMMVAHDFGDPAFSFYNDGTDLETGVRWDVAPNLMINPYLNLYPGGKIDLKSTSLGMLVSWTLL